MQDILIIMNAPPRAGKDTLSGYLVTELRENSQNIHHVGFKSGLEMVVKAMLQVAGISWAQWEILYEKHKDEPLEALGGMSPRQLYIHASETLMKPIFGKSVFSNYLLRICETHQRQAYRNTQCVFLCSDGGFAEELKTVVHGFQGKVFVLQWESEGCSFSNDSRCKLNPIDFPTVQFVQLPENYRDDLSNEFTARQVKELCRYPYLARNSFLKLGVWLTESGEIIKRVIYEHGEKTSNL